MKLKNLLLLAPLFLSSFLFAQVPQGMNYQAVARDGSGSVLQNQLVKVRFSIHTATATGTVVYKETDTATTNQFGLFTTVIGQGVVIQGSFSAISWTSPKYLQVEIDPTGGNTFTDMGTTQLMSVPFALYAATSGSNSPGVSQTLDEAYDNGGRGLGRTIIADTGAVKITGTDGLLVTGTLSVGSTADIPSGQGARMFFNPNKAAFRAGYVFDSTWNLSKIGKHSIAMGENTLASGESSTAFGLRSTASGDYSFASGLLSAAKGRSSTALGFAYALGDNSTAIGQYDSAIGIVSTAIGYGSRAYGSYSVAIGADAKARSPYAVAIGHFATSDGGTALGNSTFSSNLGTAMGDHTSAVGGTAMGSYCTSNGGTAMGSSAKATGVLSTAIGSGITSPSADEIVIGRLNTDYTPLDTLSWNVNDRLFVIGNGTSASTKKNAMVVLKNGNTGFGNSIPKSTVQVTNGDVYIDTSTKGVIMKSPNGGCWRLTVDNAGAPLFTAITCP